MKTLLVAAVIGLAPLGAFAQDWTGPYAGFQLGGSDVDVDGAPLTGDGISYGLFAGYNVQTGGMVVGGEFDYDVTEYDVDGVDIDSTTRLKARLGGQLGAGLAYGTVGIVRATSPDIGDDNGYLFGVGYDAKITPTTTVGAELLQHRWDDYDDSGLDVNVITLKARVAFNF